MADTFAQIIGTKELERAFKEIADEPAKNAMRKVMRQSANYVKNEIKSRAPVGTVDRFRKDGSLIPHGALKRGIITKSKQRYWADRLSPEYIVANNYRKAPHAHLVEYGHAIVRGGKRGKGGAVVGQVKGVRYFRRGIDASRNGATRIIMSGANKIIRERWRQLGKK